MVSRFTSYELKEVSFSDFQMTYAEMLLRAGADPDISEGIGYGYPKPLLLWNMIYGEPAIRELLLMYNADVNNVDYSGQTALHNCAIGSFVMIDIAKRLLATGADPNIQDNEGKIPLFLALEGNKVGMVELLLEHSDLSLKDYCGGTALHAIQYLQNPVAAQFLTRLLELGLDKEAVSHHGYTVLFQTILLLNYECLKICIDAGCNVNVKDRDGETTLQRLLGTYSSRGIEERMAACQWLIDAGADVDLNNPGGESLVECAARYYYVPVVKKLLQVNCPVGLKKTFPGLNHFMHVALREKAKDCAVFLFGDCFSTEDQLFFYEVSHQPDAMLDGESIGLSRPPISLYRLSRRAVRSLLPTGPAFIPALNGLPLPRNVQDFVALRP